MDMLSKATLESVTSKIYKGKKCGKCDKGVDEPENEKWGIKPKAAPMPKISKV
jgi:hypothetical protein